MINVKSKKISLIVLLVSLLVIIFVLGITGGLNIVSFQDNYTESLLNGYSVTGNETVRKIEYAVKYGKPLDNFFGIEKELQELKDNLPHVEEAQIVLLDGTIAYNQEGVVAGKKISPEIVESLQFTEPGTLEYFSSLEEGKYNLFLPVRDRVGDWVGSMNIIFDEEVIKSNTGQYLENLLFYLYVLILIAALLIVIFIAQVPFVTKDNQIMQKRLMVCFFIILGVTQVLFGYINYNIFKGAYVDIAEENAALVTNIMQKDIESVIAKGVPYSQLYQVDDYLNRIVAGIPAIEKVNIAVGEDQEIYALGDENAYSIKLITDSRGEESRINVTLATNFLQNQMNEIILDMLTVLVVSLILMVEVILFIVIFLKRQLKKEAEKLLDRKEEEQDLTICRPLAYILFFAIFMAASYIPVLMGELYQQPILGLSRNVVVGLPISAEMLFAAIATIVAGHFIDKIGWRRVLFIGFSFLGTGLLLSGLAWEPILFIFARGISGIGYGLTLMSMRSFANTSPTEEGKTMAVSSLLAGMYAGIINGVVIGAMFADRIGYSYVFFIAFSTVAVAVLFTLIFIRSEEKKKLSTDSKKEQEKPKLKSFFADRGVVFFFLLILMPTAICTMFLDYYFPLFAESIGISTSNVGRAFMLNSLSIVYLGPVISKYASRYLSNEKSILISGSIVAGAMIFFAIEGTLVAAFVAVILLGIADSLGLVAQNNYFTGLKASKDIGVGKALGFYSNVKKIGQMLGPMIFGGLAFMGLMGFGLVGVLFLISLVVFWFTRQKQQLDITSKQISS